MSSLLIDIENKTFDNGTCTLSELHLDVKQSEFVAIVGPSGTGKTTLLNIIAGIDHEFTGSIKFNEKVSTDKKISFMFQDARLLPWLTVQQNIELVVAENNQEVQARISNLLMKVGLQDVRDHYPNQLSGGMKRRVSMVRAFINQPPLLLMDEPFQSLDAPTANELRLMLFELWKETKCTIVFVTHSLREALTMSDRVAFLSSCPAQVILDYEIEIPRPRQLEDEKITMLHTNLLNQYPQLLSGSLEKKEGL
ncbi:MAG: ABC transporter ATP-binding protein [Cocleimonas sp.]|nr:ABC transporter ATP-binding protein [Cocleimonas sp.]